MGCALCKPTTTTTTTTTTTREPPLPRRRGGGGFVSSQKDNIQQQSNNSKSFEFGNNINGGSGELSRIVLDPFGPTNEFGWPLWLADVVGDVINSFSPRRATSFQKLDKIGQGTYSNVYKARDLVTGNIVALKKVRFDRTEPEGVKFMAREIIILCRLNHPNVIKLQGLVTSRMSSSVYLIFDYMEHDLSGLFASHHHSNSTSSSSFTLPQIKCYMKQLFSGLEHCHNNGVLHRDIKGSNLLIDNEGNLKIADFGLATCYDPRHKQPMTSRVVTLWYRPPELLLGATSYGFGVDLWSAGCILAELLGGKPILPGRTEVEQLHKIFKLCGSPVDEYWKKYKLPNATLFKPQQPYKRCVLETFKDFPPTSLPLLDALLSIDPEGRPTATDALNSEFFSSEPYACEPSSLPKYSPSKEMDVKLRNEGSRRQRSSSVKANDAYGSRRVRMHDRVSRGVPAPEANAELQSNIDRIRLSTQANAKAKSVKFPPPHQDGRVGVLDTSTNGPSSFGGPTESPSNALHFNSKLSKSSRNFAPTVGPSNRKRNNQESDLASPWKFIHAWKPPTIGLSMDLMFKSRGVTRVSSSRQ